MKMLEWAAARLSALVACAALIAQPALASQDTQAQQLANQALAQITTLSGTVAANSAAIAALGSGTASLNIAALPAASTLSGAEAAPCVQSGVTSKCTVAQQAAYDLGSPLDSALSSRGISGSAITTNASNISTLSGTVSGLQTSVGTNTSDITTLKSNVSSNTSAITGLGTSKLNADLTLLPAAGALSGAEPSPVTQGGATKTATPAQYAAYSFGVSPSTLRAAANRVGALGGTTNTQTAGNMTLTNATYRTAHSAPAGSAVSDLVVCFANWSMTSTGEAVGANTITDKAALEISGTSYPLFFNGAATVAIQPGGTACADPLPVTITAGTLFYSRVNVANGGSGTWPLGRSFASGGDSSNAGASGGDVVSSTGSISGVASAQYGPVSIIGRVATPTVAPGLLTDSIGAGLGDYVSLGLYQGFMERGLTNTVPWISASRGGYKAAFVAPPLSRALSVFARGAVTSVIDELGVNDTGSSANLAAMQATKITEWGLIAARGLPIVQTTITPTTTTSTDNWTSVANQATSNTSAEAIRTAFNDWLRAGAPMVNGSAVAIGTSGAIVAGQAGHPLRGYIEIADYAESARNSGKFAVASTARTVTDAAVSTSTPTTLTSSTAAFTQADVGTTVYIAGAGASGANLSTSILSVQSATSATLLNSASTTVSGASLAIGGLTADGLHPTPALHILLAARVAAAKTSGLIQ